MNKHAPCKLPEKPVDRYEIRWWTVESYDVPTVVSHRAVYYINATWKEVVGDDDHRRPGVAFVNNWQIFRGDHFTGRNVGWSTDDWHWHEDDHATLAAAQAAAARMCRKSLEHARDHAARLEVALAALEQAGAC